MQVFLPYAEDFEKSAQSLDDLRLNKQIVEICQILTIQMNQTICKNKTIAYANHPVVKQYNSEQGKNFLLEYGFALCKEYLFRFGKYHQGNFTLIGLQIKLRELNLICDSVVKTVAVYIKGQKGKDQIISKIDVSILYQQLLLDKWSKENPKWTKQNPPEFYNR